MIIETHIHLTHNQYDDDRDSIINDCHKNGIEKIIDIGCDAKSIYETLKLAEAYSFVKSAIGLHPVDVTTRTPQIIADISMIAKSNPNVIAIGEIGLDYHWYPEQKEQQLDLFREQMEIAKELKLPVIIHSRDAYEDCLQVIKEFPEVIGVIHSFSSDWKTAQHFIECGYYIGIGGPVTFKNGANQKEVVANIDSSNLLIETDGPYLTPTPFRGKRNEPKYLKYILEEIAAVRQEDVKELEKKIYENSLRLFKGLEDEQI